MRRITLLLLLVLTSCSHSTDPGECEDPRCYFEAITLEATHNVERTVAGVEVVDVASGEFRQEIEGRGLAGDYFYVSAGKVILNGRTLHTPEDYSSHYVLDTNDALILTPPGIFNVWTVSGSRDISPLVDSIATPDDRFHVTFPSPGDTVSMSEKIPVAWSTDATVEGHEDDVYIRVTQGDDPTDRVSFGYSAALVDGVAELPAETLPRLGFLPGPARISVTRSVVLHRFAADGIHYSLRFSTIEAVYVVLSE